MRRLLAILALCLLPLSAGAFPDTSILDTFTSANTDPIAGNWSGPIKPGMAQMKIVSNALKQSLVVAGQSGSSYWNAANFGPGVEVYVTVTTWWNNASSDFWLWANGNNENAAGVDGYLTYIPNGGTWSINRTDNNVDTQLGATLVTQTISNGDAIGVSIQGGTITGWYKASGGSWASQGTRSDSTYTSGHIGVSKGFVDSTSVLDDFGGGTIPSSRVRLLTGVGQ